LLIKNKSAQEKLDRIQSRILEVNEGFEVELEEIERELEEIKREAMIRKMAVEIKRKTALTLLNKEINRVQLELGIVNRVPPLASNIAKENSSNREGMEQRTVSRKKRAAAPSPEPSVESSSKRPRIERGPSGNTIILRPRRRDSGQAFTLPASSRISGSDPTEPSDPRTVISQISRSEPAREPSLTSAMADMTISDTPEASLSRLTSPNISDAEPNPASTIPPATSKLSSPNSTPPSSPPLTAIQSVLLRAIAAEASLLLAASQISSSESGEPSSVPSTATETSTPESSQPSTTPPATPPIPAYGPDETFEILYFKHAHGPRTFTSEQVPMLKYHARFKAFLPFDPVKGSLHIQFPQLAFRGSSIWRAYFIPAEGGGGVVTLRCRPNQGWPMELGMKKMEDGRRLVDLTKECQPVPK
jgi:hypothetical protein